MIPDLELLLVRHGKSEGNKEGWVFLGHTDSPLDVRGKRQAQQLAQHLAEEQITAVYSSPLQRAKETAVYLAKPHHLTPQIDPRLIEQDFGAWDTLSFAEVEKQYAKDIRKWQGNAYEHGPTNGENLKSVTTRLTDFYNEITSKYHHEKILVVAHGGLLNAFLCLLLNTRLQWRWAYRFDTVMVTEVQIYDETAVLTRFNAS